MKMTLRTLLIVLLGLAALAVARPASAGYSSYSVTSTYGIPIALQNTFSTNSTAFALFDPTQGSLAAVFVSLSSTTTVSSGVSNGSMVSTNTFTVSDNDMVTVTALNNSTTVMAAQASNQVSGSINPNSTLTNLGAVTATTSSLAISQSDLKDYIGLGTAELKVDGSTAVSGSVTGGPTNPLVSFSSAALFSGTITITYEYTPAVPVPEPASLAMVAIGFGAMFAASRRVRRNA